MRSKQQPRPSYRWINDREENGKHKKPISHQFKTLFRCNYEKMKIISLWLREKNENHKKIP
jgi:hypothetical protein